MSFKAVRSPVSMLLVFAFLMALFPASYAGSESDPAAQAATRARRGKNGVDDKDSAGQRTESVPADSEPSRQEAQGGPPRTPTVDDKPESTVAGRRQDRAQERSASAVDEPGNARQSGKRPEPPPFDRPPANSNRSDSSTGPIRSGNQTGTADRQQSGTRQTSTADDASSSAGAGRESSDRSRGSEPVLGRPADSRNPSRTPDSADPERGRSNKPSLHRPSDPEDSGVPAPRSSEKPQSDRGPAPNDQNEVIKLDATLVNIPILVSDRSGRYVPQLTKRDFILYEDGVQQEVAFFGSEEVPFNVALVLDMSPSVQGSNEDIQDAAIEFVRQLRPDDRVMIVSFDRRVHFLTDLTNNRRVLESAIRSTSTGSGTSVYDAVFEVVERLRQVDGRKALILFSDGEDTTSNRASYDESIDAVTESDVLVYGLRYPGTGSNVRVNPWPRSPIPQIPFPFPFPFPWPRRRGHFTNYASPPVSDGSGSSSAAVQNWPRRNSSRDYMTDLATAGGGPVYDAEKIGDLSRLAGRIADELRHVYVISYYPTNALSNGGFRTLRVRVKGRDELAVRHRRGYNARDVKRGK